MASEKHTLLEGEALVNIIAEKYLKNLAEERELDKQAQEARRQRDLCKEQCKWWQRLFKRCPDETDGLYADMRVLRKAREVMANEVINIILNTEHCGYLYEGFWPYKLSFVEAYSEEIYAYRDPDEYFGEDDAVCIMDYDMSKPLSEQVLKALDNALRNTNEDIQRLGSSLASKKEYLTRIEYTLNNVRQELSQTA